MTDAMLLVAAMRDPDSTSALDSAGWTALLTMARAEQMIGSLAHRLQDQPVPNAVAAILSDARLNADHQRKTALWEADACRRALADYKAKTVLMKGTAYVAANLEAGIGRHIGDLDIMVAEEDLAQVEALLLTKGGWEWVKEDAYDDAYYRDHMHELPPLIHKERDRMIDVHHTILPKTAGPSPDAIGMLDRSVPLPFRGGVRGGGSLSNKALADSPSSQPSPLKGGGLYTFAPTDMVCHSAAHLFADGDLTGGLRNLWDIHCLLREFSGQDAEFPAKLQSRAQHHELTKAVDRAVRLAGHLYGQKSGSISLADRLYVRRLTARNRYGQTSRKLTRLLFYIRSHWLRMPPLMLANHLWTKWRKGKGAK